MKVYRSLEEFHKLKYAVVTSGVFDGVHKGHQKILNRLKEISIDNNGESVVITFWPHPKKVLTPTEPGPALLSVLEEKIKLLEHCGIDHLLIIPFTKGFAELSSSEFVSEVLVNKIGTKKLVIGYDHKFGKNREGSFEYLKAHSGQYGFTVEEISKQEIDHIAVSSTNIRNALMVGQVNNAAHYLGRCYSITGTVVKGKQLGKTIGYPTANILVNDPEKLIPSDGIYAVKIGLGNVTYKGMMSIGYNPTVNGTKKTIEVNIFDFNEDIYGKELEIFFIQYLRKEEKFNSLEDLIIQLGKDKENSLRSLAD